MLRALQTDVKRLSYDGIHTLHFVFYSKRAANRWKLKTMRFQKSVIELQDTNRQTDEDTGHYTTACSMSNMLEPVVLTSLTIDTTRSAPRHSKQNCTVTPARLQCARARATRIFNATITNDDPAEWTNFCVESFEDLLTLLHQYQRPPLSVSPLVKLDQEAVPVTSPSGAHSLDHIDPSDTATSTGDKVPDADGLYTKRQKQKSRTAKYSLLKSRAWSSQAKIVQVNRCQTI
ncbi:unnamed protein product [Phytophthora fragariaefolia]|uniref:Unnamed protein product n=1 Tax=Phytophthora fragariaefolia TaxID=1490495 RepID=A0A9W6YFS8_9STRA|nr:unnamed protein product [Phytophthora fragariaefolia]